MRNRENVYGWFCCLKVQQECAVEVPAVEVGMKQLLSVCKTKLECPAWAHEKPNSHLQTDASPTFKWFFSSSESIIL